MKRPFSPRCTPVAGSERIVAPELHSLRFDDEALELRVQAPDGTRARLVFGDVAGFRVLDENDLLEFWNAYSQPHGWLWRVEAGGWLELERTRAMFDTIEAYGEVHEYLIVGDQCVSVLAHRAPELTVDA